MTDFQSWYSELKDNKLWWIRINEMNRNKNLNRIAEEVHAYLMARDELKGEDWPRFRTLFQSFARNAKEEAVRPQLQQEVKVEVTVQEPPLTGEARQQKLKEWLDVVNQTPMMKTPPKISYAEIAEQGGVRRPKDKPFPKDSPEYIYIKERHIAWIRNSFEPISGQRIPGTLDEEEFNKKFDEL